MYQAHMEPLKLSLEEALELSPSGLFQYRLFGICGLAFMIDSLGVNLLSFLTTCAAADWKLSNAGQAMLTSIVFVGMIIGSLFWGRYADHFGRKKTLLYACLMVTIGGFASAIAPSYIFLVLFRAVAGFGIGGASVPFDLLAEFLPLATRSKYLVYMGIFWTLGSMFVAGMAWAVLPVLGWRFLSFLTTVPVLFTMLLAYVYLPESPRWLVEVGQQAEAIKVIREAALVNGEVLPEFYLTVHQSDQNDNDTSLETTHGSYAELINSPEARRITLPLWVIWTLFGFTYYGIILFVSRIYSNQDDISQHNDTEGGATARCDFNYAAIFYNAAAEILSVLVSASLIETLGHIKSQSVFYVLGGVGVMCMGLSTSPGAVLFFSLIARMGVNSGLVATWVVTPELFSTEVRTMGHSSCTAVSRIGSFLTSFLVVSDLSYPTIGVVLGVLNVVAALAAHFLPDTTGKNLDDVNARTRHKSASATTDYSLIEMSRSHHPLHQQQQQGGGLQRTHLTSMNNTESNHNLNNSSSSHTSSSTTAMSSNELTELELTLTTNTITTTRPGQLLLHHKSHSNHNKVKLEYS